MDKPSPRIGQRWLWDDGREKAIAEVVERESSGAYRVKVIQIIKGEGISGYGLNNTLVPSWILAGWSYLSGQDKPQ